MNTIVDMYPANNFSVVCDNAAKEVKSGIIIGYDDRGILCVFAGGMLNNEQPTQKDWLWMIETFRHKLLDGDYS